MQSRKGGRNEPSRLAGINRFLGGRRWLVNDYGRGDWRLGHLVGLVARMIKTIGTKRELPNGVEKRSLIWFKWVKHNNYPFNHFSLWITLPRCWIFGFGFATGWPPRGLHLSRISGPTGQYQQWWHWKLITGGPVFVFGLERPTHRMLGPEEWPE